MSAVEHKNRRGDTYYLQAGKTRTGKPRYWFGRKLTGEPVESAPAGYEIYEHPEGALVSLRKIKSTEISQLERDILSDGIRRYAGLEHFIVDVDGDSMVVYLPDMDEEEADRMLNMLAGPLIREGNSPIFVVRQSGASPWYSSRMQAAKASMIRASNYTKMMRFALVNPDERFFVVQRWRFCGSVDDWIWAGGPASLADLVRQYGQHLGKESFYELM